MFSFTFDTKLAMFKEQLSHEQKIENEHLTKKLKPEKNSSFAAKAVKYSIRNEHIIILANAAHCGVRRSNL